MTRKQLFTVAAVAALMISSMAAVSSAGLVEIRLLGDGGSIQTLTLYVPENCARTEWPAQVISCEDVNPDYQPPTPAPVQYVRSPRGRLFRLAELRTDDSAYQGGSNGVDRGHTEDVHELGQTVGGGSVINIGNDQNGKVDVVVVDFKNQGSWNKFKSGTESDDVPTGWGAIKSRYGE